MNTELPVPDAAARAASDALCSEIRALIERNDGFLPFADYMHHVLYAPHNGYYSGGSHKIGSGGDFVTAPQLTPLFGQTLARQFADILPQTAGNLYEFGAGTGALAADIIGALPPECWDTYYIVEVSPDLRARQQALLAQKHPQLAARVRYLDRLPETFDGIIFGNEVLDAMPCERVEWRNDGLYRLGVEHSAHGLTWGARPAPPTLCEWAARLPPLPVGYRSELHPQQEAFVRTLAGKLQRGAMLWIDYGFDENEYYHPQRHMGTLIGHYRHHTVDDPFFLPGLVDWTAHVNFSGIAAAACDAGLDFIGYTTQGSFLVQAGITAALEAVGTPEGETYIRAAAACQKLLATHEMGELFKVIAFGMNIDPDWSGFRGADLSAKL
ncbi:MAG: SAM-dependent methyltransferase [Neisseria sp.]|nr:SAM-dependent methyltransferase [Neisseria sp.]